MVIYISTRDKINEILIENIPVKKWVNICINVINKIVVIYFNSKLFRTLRLSSSATVYPYDLHICANGGFDGYIHEDKQKMPRLTLYLLHASNIF